MSVVLEVARCGASTQLRPDLASTVGPSVRRASTKGLASTGPLASYTECHSPTSTGFFQQHRNTTTLCSSGWVTTYKKAKTQSHPRSPESRLIKPALFIKRNPTSSALSTTRGVQTWTQKHKRLPASFQCIESSGYSKHRSTKTSTIVLHCSQITFPGSKNTSTNTAK